MLNHISTFLDITVDLSLILIENLQRLTPHFFTHNYYNYLLCHRGIFSRTCSPSSRCLLIPRILAVSPLNKSICMYLSMERLAQSSRTNISNTSEQPLKQNREDLIFVLLPRAIYNQLWHLTINSHKITSTRTTTTALAERWKKNCVVSPVCPYVFACVCAMEAKVRHLFRFCVL